MKKLISFIIIISIIACTVPTEAAKSYMKLDPYPYSTHVLGEDLVIYGDTDFPEVVLGLFYPYENGYYGMSKYIINISADELRAGHVIKTETVSRLWPEGNWRVKIQHGDVFDEIYITMSESPQYDRTLKVAEYENSALTSLTSYSTRGVQFKNNVLSFSSEDGTVVKIFSWNNFAPVHTGESRIYIAFFKDGCLTRAQTYEGELSAYGKHISLKIDDTKTVKIFYWNEELSPID